MSKTNMESQLKTWMLEALDDNEASYRLFLENSARILRSYLSRAMPAAQRGSVEDLVQEILIAVHSKRHTYRIEAPILPWLFAIGKYKMIDHSRKLKVRPITVDWKESIEEIYNDSELTAAAEAEFSVKEQVEDFLSELSPQQSELIRLAKLQEIPLAEVAVQTQLSLANVKVGIHRSLKKLTAISEKRKVDQRRKS